ncbi:MAG: BamA/TamA family outer membrane protein [Gammaproteobacteria bacterium]|nr:BamA/TamA family outer membrane protein [Gammaproteobacteria bacterium]
MSKYYKRLVFFISLILLTAASTPKPPKFTVTGLEKTQKTNVEHRLADLYAHPTSHRISKNILERQIKKALTPYGYFNPTITITTPSPHHPGNIHVIPGPQLVITHLTVQISGPGRYNPEIRQAYHDFPIQEGDGFNSILYEEAKNSLTNAAEHQGYLNSTFEEAYVFIDKEKNQATILLHLDTGIRSYFGRIKFGTGKPRPTPPVKDAPPLPRLSKILAIFNPEGRSDTLFSQKHIIISNRLLYRYVPFKYGHPYSNDDIMELNSNLKSSGFFKTVDVKPGNENGRYVPLNVYLEPIERFRYSVSGGYGTDTGARGRLGLHVVPVNSYGHKLDLVAQGSSNQNAAQAKYTIPGRDPVHDQYNINGGFNNLNYVSGNSQAGRMSLVYQHITPKYQRILSLNGLHEAFRYDKQSPDERTVVYPRATLTWREVTNPLFSPSGFNVTVNGLAATRAVFSSLSLAELSLDAKGAITIDVLRTRFYGHIVQGITQVNDVFTLPLSLAQLLGGPETMKGFSYNSIGPGKILSYGGIEVQKETLDTWYVIAFIDKGTVYRPDPKLVQYDVGFGLMWRSPVGPIKAAIAQPTNSRLNPMPDTGIRFVVNMGPDI